MPNNYPLPEGKVLGLGQLSVCLSVSVNLKNSQKLMIRNLSKPHARCPRGYIAILYENNLDTDADPDSRTY